MRHLIILFTVVLAGYLASSTPIDHKHRLVNRPSMREIFGGRSRRSDQYAKGGQRRAGFVKFPVKRPEQLGLIVRKGEYICGGQVCQLKPGQKTCPMCQYPIAL